MLEWLRRFRASFSAVLLTVRMSSRGPRPPIDRRLALRVFLVNLLARLVWDAVSPYVRPPLQEAVWVLVHVVIPTLLHVGLFTFGG